MADQTEELQRIIASIRWEDPQDVRIRMEQLVKAIRDTFKAHDERLTALE